MKNGRGSGTVVMVFSGEYDLACKDQAREAFEAVSEAPRVALDFTDVTYMDSSMIHELLRLHNARAAGELERETVVVRSANLLRIFEILHLTSVLRVVESLDEAIGKNGEDVTVRYASTFNGAAHGNNAIKGSAT